MTSFAIDPTKAKASNVANPYDFQGVSAKPPPSSYQRVGSRAAPIPGTAQRLGTAMKSNASAGFKSKPLPEGIAATHGTQPNIEEKKEKSEEEHFKELEEEVHRLLEQSATAKVQKNNNDAL